MSSLLESCLEQFQHVSLLKDEQKEVDVHLLRSEDVLKILLTGFGKILIYQLYAPAKHMQIGANVVALIVLPLESIMKEQVIEI